MFPSILGAKQTLLIILPVRPYSVDVTVSSPARRGVVLAVLLHLSLAPQDTWGANFYSVQNSRNSFSAPGKFLSVPIQVRK